MARVLKHFPEPEDPLNPKGAVRRAVWRAIKHSFADAHVNLRPFVTVGVIWVMYELGNPHLRYEYTYFGTGAALTYTRCDYVGLEPFRTYGPYCPIIRFREWPKF